MALELIVGPPNSNRAGAVLERLREALDRDPVLVVPTGDDIVRFERDLCAGGVPQVGATIRTFASLFDEIAGLTATPVPPRLSPPQRLALVRAAVASTDLRLLRRSSASPGFAPALDTLIAELQAALVIPRGPPGCRRRAEGDAAQEGELARLYAEYERLRDGAGRSDGGSVAAAAVAALRAQPERLGRHAGAHLRLRRPHGGPARPHRRSGRRLRRHLRRELLGPQRARGARRPVDAPGGRGRHGRRGARVRLALHEPKLARPHRPERLRDRSRNGQSARRRARVPRQRRRARRGRSRGDRDRAPPRRPGRAPTTSSSRFGAPPWRDPCSRPSCARWASRRRSRRTCRSHPRRSASRCSRSAAPPRTTASPPT